jgi:hypothetical protein
LDRQQRGADAWYRWLNRTSVPMHLCGQVAIGDRSNLEGSALQPRPDRRRKPWNRNGWEPLCSIMWSNEAVVSRIPRLAMPRALIISALLALLYSLAWGLGSYALAPGGAYVDWTMQGVSHDWHQYRWFFQIPSTGWYALAVLGVFVGGFSAAFVVPITCAVGAFLFWSVPVLKQRLLGVNRVRLSCAVIVLGLLTGVAATIISGRNPGIP